MTAAAAPAASTATATSTCSLSVEFTLIYPLDTATAFRALYFINVTGVHYFKKFFTAFFTFKIN